MTRKAPHQDDDYEEDPAIFYGLGSVSTITEYKPSQAERRQMKKRQPIGFVHFPDRD